jgi:HSP20 family protein
MQTKQVFKRYSNLKGSKAMIVRYWQPLREVDTIRRQMDRLLDDLIETNGDRPNWSPAAELKDAGDAFVLKLQIPGVDEKDLDIQVTKDTVKIAGELRREQQNQENGYHRSEFRYGKFSRTVGLPIAVQNDQVQANYKDGILSLTLPKVVEARNKVVKVNLVGSGNTAEPIAPGAAEATPEVSSAAS